MAEETGLTRTGAFLGTAAWISPEQILGRDVTEKCDVFNLGLVVAYAATGRHPYGEGRPDAVMYRISNMGADLEGIDEPLRTALRRCLQSEPHVRPSITELLAFFTSSGQESLPGAPLAPEGSTVIVQPSDLDQTVRSDQQQGLSEPASGGPPTPPKRKRRLLPALAVIALAAGAVAYLSLIHI